MQYWCRFTHQYWNICSESSPIIINKLTPITDKICCCLSGSAADTEAIADIVAYCPSYYESQTDLADDKKKLFLEEECNIGADSRTSTGIYVANHHQLSSTN